MLEQIKKDWNTFKKEITKGNDPYELKGSFYMTKKQIEKGTATICLVYAKSYEAEIDYYQRASEKLKGYNTWTAEAIANRIKEHDEIIAKYTAKLEKHGTKLNEAKWKIEAITNSEAWKKFSAAVNVKGTELEEKNNCYYLRIYY